MSIEWDRGYPYGKQFDRLKVFALFGALYLITGACAFAKSRTVDEVLVDNPHGAVFLQKAEDGWFRTAHPFDLSPEVLSTVFQGVGVLVSSTDRATDHRLFSDEEAEFLSTQISAALSKATKSQVVGFRVMHDMEGRQEATGGIFYVQGRLLHLTLTHYRARHEHSERTDKLGRSHSNPTGLAKHQIVFSPESAKRSSRNEQPDVIASPPLASLVLDYEALITESSLSPASVHSRPIRPDKASVFQQIVEPMFPMNGDPASHDGRTILDEASHATLAPAAGKEGEIEALKEEVRILQRRLSQLDGELQKSKKP
ncbi:MAG: hypothetical protein IPK92_04830 [Nitrospira sp.]|jgi:hypothetical protein|nr:hypothetical protein [Nitrospira sp.]MBL8053095.1 hypothetical protein [Nitrospira sp.]